MSGLDNEDWFVSCSDEEKYTSTGCKKGKLQWTPKPEVMIQLFEQIDKGEKEGNCLYLTESNLNLEWKCPGRRPPTPSDESDMDEDYEGMVPSSSNNSTLSAILTNITGKSQYFDHMLLFGIVFR